MNSNKSEIKSLPKIAVTDNEVIWLKEAWKLLKSTGKKVPYKTIRKNTISKTGKDFNPLTIDSRLIKEHSSNITLLGLLTIEPETEILEIANKVVKLIKNNLIEDPHHEKFILSELSIELEVEVKILGITFYLISQIQGFSSGAGSSSKHDQSSIWYEYYGISLRDNSDFYMQFESIEKTINDYYFKIEQNQNAYQEYEKELTHKVDKNSIPSDNLFPLELLINSRGYLEKTGRQACFCYDYELYDASVVMLRKLIETLIIECFERLGIESKIKGIDGHYKFLSDLIDSFISEKIWSHSRILATSIKQIKKLGDLSAHNRRFSCTKSDIDKVSSDFRLAIEELVQLIDYPNWNKK